MRLKSLELQGFKSFPDRTLLNFDRGITAVVGPNGSGKSNISDAVRWVLGEISSKSIRGTKMEDVIFGGTDKRRAMTFAEVSLTIDNTDEDGRIEIDTDEVTVTRRYYRSGESEYMINRKPVRLKDIAELFMNTGIGRTGYSIIGQGKIAEIISQKSDERRSIFEEAAGISKYRYKKDEAERKLKEVDDNSERLNDILREVESRLPSLEAESEKAKKYLELYETKKRTDVSLWLYDIKAVKRQLNELENNISVAGNELDTADENISSAETQGEKVFNIIQELKLKAERTSRKIRESTEQKYTAESNLKVSSNDIVHLHAQIVQSENDLKIKKDSLSSAQERIKTINDNLVSLRNEYSGLESQYAENERIKSYAVSMISEKSELIRKAEEAIAVCDREIVDNKIKLSALEASAGSELERRLSLRNELAEYRDALESLEKRMCLAQNNIADCKEKQKGLGASVESSNEKLSVLLKERENLTDRINAVKLDVSSKKQRIDTLRRMEEHFEGYAQSVRFVMNNAEAGSIDGVYGPVSHIINVKPRYSVAVETSLGSNIQNIVVENEEAAKLAISLLKTNNAGRATFYPLTSIKSVPLNIDKESLKKYKGFIGIASELVSSDMKFSEIIGYMLGRTVVFDNIDNAAVMAKAFGYRVRVVTLDGQLINAGGSFTGGSVKRDSGMLTRTSEISRIEGDAVRAEIEVKAFEEQIIEHNLQIEAVTAEANEIKKQLSMLNSLQQAEETQFKIMSSQCESDKKHISALNDSLNALQRQNDKYEADRILFNLKNDEMSERKSAEISERDKLKSELESLNRENEALIQKSNELLLKITVYEKDISSAEKSYAFASETEKTLVAQIQKDEENIYACNESIIKAESAIEAGKLLIVSLEKDLKDYENEQRFIIEQTAKYERQSEELRSKLRELTRKRELIFSEHSKLESRHAQVLSEQDKMVSRLWEDYELTYSTAIELDYPEIDESTRMTAAALQTELHRKLRDIGPVNVGAVDEYRDVKGRFDFLNGQLEDLKKSRVNLINIIYRLESEMRLQFSQAMETINFHFGNVFRELFGGGSAEVKLSDPDDVLASGIDINVAPPGKIIKSLMLLSGGEQSFVAIALFFAILKVNPTPFCVLDEIEAALDEVNVQRFAEYARMYSDNTQFIIITHRRGAMEAADTLYGVTMYERGISKVLSLNVNEVEQKIGVKL